MLSDSHTHLDQYQPWEIEGVLNRALEASVGPIITAGTTIESSRNCVALASRYPNVFAGIGIHPMDIRSPFTQDTYDLLKELAESSEKVVAVSEVGLDFMEGAPDRELQYHAFRRQIGLAKELGLPIVFHSREAHDETFRVLQEERAYEVGGVMHYFQGDEAVADRCLKLDFYISLARPLLRLPHLQELAARLPMHRIILETDSFPQPFKKKRERWTEPRHVREVAQKLAELRGIPLQEVEKATTGNLLRVLGRKAAVVEAYTQTSGPPGKPS